MRVARFVDKETNAVRYFDPSNVVMTVFETGEVYLEVMGSEDFYPTTNEYETLQELGWSLRTMAVDDVSIIETPAPPQSATITVHNMGFSSKDLTEMARKHLEAAEAYEAQKTPAPKKEEEKKGPPRLTPQEMDEATKALRERVKQLQSMQNKSA